MPEVKMLKQRRKAFIWQPAKAINRKQAYFDEKNIDEKEISALKEKIEFVLFKLKLITEQICSIIDVDECEKSKKMYDENSVWTKNTSYISIRFLEVYNLEVQSEIPHYAFDKHYGSVVSKTENKVQILSSKSSGLKTSQKRLIMQNENRAKRVFNLL